MRSHVRVVASLIVSSTLVACASASDDTAAPGDEQDLTAAGVAAQAACGDKFAPAHAKYREAIKLAKAQLAATSQCETSLGGAVTADTIADPAASSVLLCPEMKEVIRTSPFAEPIRHALADNLVLPALTGELLVLRDTAFQNWTSVEARLPGVVMSTFPQGAVGLAVQIDFGQNGTATWTIQDNAPPPDFVSIKKMQATYTVVKTGDDRAPRLIQVVREDGKSITYKLGLDALPATDFSSAPDFMLTPVSGDIAAFTGPHGTGGANELHSFWDDCGI